MKRGRTTSVVSVVRVAAVIALGSCVAAGSAQAQTIIDEWASISALPPPELKAVNVDKATTALVMLDFNHQTCNMERRPRCVASIPKVKKLLAAARAAGVPVAFSLGGGGKPTDIPTDLTPTANEPVVSSGLDKFAGTDLEKFLKDKGVRNVIMVGAAAHGAVLYTASTAAAHGFNVIIPVDGISADWPYAEQYTIWHFANVPILAKQFTFTRLDEIRF